MIEVELTEHAMTMLDDLVDFAEKSREEIIEEGLLHLTHAYNGTEMLEAEAK